jgi:hypothetical protein
MFQLLAGSYRFKVVVSGVTYWSGASNTCTIPGCTNDAVTVAAPVMVTVINALGMAQSGLSVSAYTGSTSAGSLQTTDANGRAVFQLALGSYRFKVLSNGVTYWSGTSNTCTIPGCTSDTIKVGVPVTVTVTNGNGDSQSGLSVSAYTGSTSAGSTQTTDANGHAVFQLLAGSYRFKVVVNSVSYWSGPSNTCTIPGCTSDTVVVTNPVTVTVQNTDGTAQSGLPVYAYSGSAAVGSSKTTDGNGQAVFNLSTGNYRFQAQQNGTTFWSSTSDSCGVPSCTSATVTVTKQVTVTVLDTGSVPQSGLKVYAFSGGAAVGSYKTTNGSGQVVFSLPTGNYRFQAQLNGANFWSDTSDSCVVSGCTSATITVTLPVTVSVLDTAGVPQSGMNVYVYSGSTVVGSSKTTGINGQVAFTLPTGNYRFQTQMNGTNFWSNTSDSCGVPGCTSATITVTLPVTVSVVDTSGTAQSGLKVYAYSGSTAVGSSKTTGMNGQVVFSLPAGSYRFQTQLNGTAFWSDTSDSCAVSGCTSTTITVTMPVTVSVVDTSGTAQSGLKVYAYSGSTAVGSSKTTSTNGQAVFSLPTGNYRFQAQLNGTTFWSDTSDSCVVSGCTSATVTVTKPVKVTVQDTAGVGQSGLLVYAYSGSSAVGSSKTSDSNGQVVFTLPTGNYRFMVQQNGTNFWSDTSDSCGVPGCTSASVAVTLPVTVSVLDTTGVPQSGLKVYAYSGSTAVGSSKTTSTNGQVVFSLPTGNYRFEAQLNDTNFWSDTSDSCAVSGCTSATVTVTKPVTVSVIDTSGAAQTSIPVFVYSGGAYAGISKSTDNNGHVIFTLPSGNYRFLAQQNGTNFWSDTSDSCGVPGCTSATVTATIPVTVSVVDTNGTAQSGLKVYAYSGGAAVGTSKTTGSTGQVVFSLPAGNYRFQAQMNGTNFWSDTSDSCTVSGCAGATVTVTKPVTVSVLDTDSVPQSDLKIYAYSGGAIVGSSKTTGTNGQVVFSLPSGNYRFQAQLNGTNFWSDTSDSCAVSGCTSATVTVTKPVTVTVRDTDAVVQFGLKVYAYSGGVVVGSSKTTDTNGQVIFTLPIGSYRFEAQRNGTNFWSDTTDSCGVPGCTSASVTVTKPVTVTVQNSSGVPQSGIRVYAYSGLSVVGSYITTNTSGQAVFTLPIGSYRFQVTKGGVVFWSGTITVPGFISASVMIAP